MSTKNRKVAIVTGATGGIGSSIVSALLERDYKVVATSRSASKSSALKPSDKLILVDGDIGERSTAVKVAQAALDNYGRIDLLVNNAGIFMPKSFTDYTEEDFNNMVKTNVASFFFMSQQVIPSMQKQKCGHIINISTTLVDQPLASVPAGLAVLTKSTMPAVSRALAIEYAKDFIRVNTISPGTVNSPMHDGEDQEFLKGLHPIHRLAEVSEIVDAMLYLDGATFVTGENLRVDGGAHAGKW
jgi:NAD(P)-dependent dehydrogenase (short-subunit alcohol dehydrogenase family)